MREVGRFEVGENAVSHGIRDGTLLVRTEEPDGGCLYAWPLEELAASVEAQGAEMGSVLTKTCFLPAGEGWHLQAAAGDRHRMVWGVWDMMEQEDVYDRDVEVADFHPDTEHGMVLLLDLTVKKHHHGDEYEFMHDLSKAHNFDEGRGDEDAAPDGGTFW